VAAEIRWQQVVKVLAMSAEICMCRNIKTLFNFEPPATNAEVSAAALQFVRKISGFNKPSLANEPAFSRAVDEVTAATQALVGASGWPRRGKRRQPSDASVVSVEPARGLARIE
jgi:hypothetical protein